VRIIGSERILPTSFLSSEENALSIRFKKTDSMLFSSGRSAIHFIIKSINQDEILFPDFYCPEMLNPVLKAGAGVSFYTVKDDFTAETDSIRPGRGVKYIFIDDYCGARDRRLEEFAEKKRLTPIIDRTHSLLSDYPFDGVQAGSLRKVLPLPDGGFASGIEGELKEERDNSFYLGKLEAKIYRELFEKGGSAGFEDEYVKLSEESEKRIRINRKRISLCSERFMAYYDVSAAKERRKRNYEILLSFTDIRRLCPLRIREKAFVPQSLPLLSEKRDLIKRMLAEKSIYAPVLWRGEGSLSKRVINIPLDEEYSEDDMVRAGEETVKAIKRSGA